MSETKNENILHGMRCPKCGSLAPFRIEAKLVILVYDDTTEEDETGCCPEWDGNSYCECRACRHPGIVADFHQKEEENTDGPTA